MMAKMKKKNYYNMLVYLIDLDPFTFFQIFCTDITFSVQRQQVFAFYNWSHLKRKCSEKEIFHTNKSST